MVDSKQVQPGGMGIVDAHPLGFCRTYVFARENTEQDILEVLRAGRTVVLDRGRAFGDPTLIPLCEGAASGRA